MQNRFGLPDDKDGDVKDDARAWRQISGLYAAAGDDD